VPDLSESLELSVVLLPSPLHSFKSNVFSRHQSLIGINLDFRFAFASHSDMGIDVLVHLKAMVFLDADVGLHSFRVDLQRNLLQLCTWIIVEALVPLRQDFS
jgi:hypothetical protein